MLHPLLKRQLRRLDLELEVPPSAEAWKELLNRISRAYEAIDRERYLAERSIELASHEMHELNAKLSQEHDTLMSVFRATPVGLATADREGRIAQSNRALEEIIGFTSQETIGRLLWDLMPAEDVAIAQGSTGT